MLCFIYSLRNTKKVLYLRWNERYLRVCFETLMSLMQTYKDAFYKQRFFEIQILLLKYVNL